jgi:predicted MFS family arabinose efflux permease
MGGVLGDLFGWRNVFFALLPALACPKGPAMTRK